MRERRMDVFGLDIGGSGIKGAPVNAESGDLLGERIRCPRRRLRRQTRW
jgi:polyphosphate glucokinase